MIKEYKLREKPNVQAVTLERSFASIGEVLTFAYGENQMYDVNALKDDDGIWLYTVGGPEKMLWGDTLVKDESGIFIQWVSVFNNLYEEVTNG